jgi:hypothetical protein
MLGSTFKAVSEPGSPSPFGLGAWALAGAVMTDAKKQRTPSATASFPGRIMWKFSQSVGAKVHFRVRHRTDASVARGGKSVFAVNDDRLEACVALQVNEGCITEVLGRRWLYLPTFKHIHPIS